MASKYCVYFLPVLAILLAGDAEVNPRPTLCRRRKCRMLYSNIRGLHANLNDLIVSSRQFDILFCSETLVSNLRSPKELLIPGFKQPNLLKRNDRRRGQGMAAYIRKGFPASRKPDYECDCHEVLVLKVCGKHKLFSFKNKYHYIYSTILSFAKVTCNTHKNKKLLSIPLKLVPSLAKLPLPYSPLPLGGASPHTQN